MSKPDPARAVLAAADMMEYRSAEIRRLSAEIRQGIRHLHRERIAEKHEKQAEKIAAKLDRIWMLMADDQYDACQLQVCLTAAPEPVRSEAGSRQLH